MDFHGSSIDISWTFFKKSRSCMSIIDVIFILLFGVLEKSDQLGDFTVNTSDYID